MGTGKTSVARILAEIMDMELVGTDELVEKKEGASINEIFSKKGESYFRKIESEVIRELSKTENSVIDAGGGVMMKEENVDNLRKNGIIFCLNANPEEILRRTSKYAHRPLLNVADPLTKIKELLAARREYYDRADYEIDTSYINVNKAAHSIIDIYKNLI